MLILRTSNVAPSTVLIFRETNSKNYEVIFFFLIEALKNLYL